MQWLQGQQGIHLRGQGTVALWGHISQRERGCSGESINLITHLAPVNSFLAGCRAENQCGSNLHHMGIWPRLFGFFCVTVFVRKLPEFSNCSQPLPEESSLALPLPLCQGHGGVTLAATCSDSGMGQAPWLHPAASKLLSICWELAEPH